MDLKLEIASADHSLEIIAERARKTRYWMYQMSSGKWYTPEEFITFFSRVRPADQQKALSDFTLRDPVRELKTQRQHLDQLAKQMQEFGLRVASYYERDGSDRPAA